MNEWMAGWMGVDGRMDEIMNGWVQVKFINSYYTFHVSQTRFIECIKSFD